MGGSVNPIKTHNLLYTAQPYAAKPINLVNHASYNGYLLLVCLYTHTPCVGASVEGESSVGAGTTE